MAKDAKDMDLDKLAQQMHLRPDSMAHLAAHAELYGGKLKLNSRRHMPRSSRLGPKKAAKASIATADATKENAKYLLASVIVVAISALASAVAAYY